MTIRVLHVGAKNNPPLHGGVEKSIHDLAASLEGVESHFAVEWALGAKCPGFVLNRSFFRRFKQIRNYVKNYGIDVVHLNKEYYLPIAAYLALVTHVKVVNTIRGCGWRVKELGRLRRLILFILDLLGVCFLKNIVFVSDEDRKFFQKFVPWRQLMFIPNGVIKHSYRINAEATGNVYLGRICPEKNILKLVRDFGSQRVHLDLYGGLDDRHEGFNTKFSELIAEYPSVSYLGEVGHTSVLEVLSRYRAYVSISFSEGMPVAVLEAGSVGLSLLLSDIPSHRALGFEDVVYLSATQTNDVSFATDRQVESKNADYVARHYSLHVTAARYIELYEA
jgi:glycosyltransferase involved in cell wall biosynthesis